MTALRRRWVSEANSQSGKMLTVAQASTIVSDADRLETVIGC